MKIFTQELLHIELNASSSVRTVYLAKAKAIAHHLNYATTFLATISCHAAYGILRTGLDWTSKTRISKTRFSKTRISKTQSSKTRNRKTRISKTRSSKTRISKTRNSKTRSCKTRSSKTLTLFQRLSVFLYKQILHIYLYTFTY